MVKKKSKGFLWKLLLVILICLGTGTYLAYRNIYQANVNLKGNKSRVIYIPRETSYARLLEILSEENIIVNKASFRWLANKMQLEKSFKCGKYRIRKGMNNREIINLLKYGKTEKIKFTFNYLDRTSDEIAEKISKKVDISKEELISVMRNEPLLQQKFGMNKETIRCIFTPGTYEMEWAVTLEEVMEIMYNRYLQVWTNERIEKAKKIGLEKTEIMILASIVQRESSIPSEQQKIAGVYLNRLQKSIKLQADPTVIFAKEDFSIKRVSKADLQFDSPYNTYKYQGLPPGPICLPNVKTIDAILNFEKHNYIYFCAKPDLSGFSNFAVNYSEHLKNAREYQQEMNKRGIFR